VYIIQMKKERNMAHIISDECSGCGSCQSECPVDAISEGTPYKIDPDACLDCGNCAEICPVGAISAAE
jgi:NAD-dependent dihydropyrimidine dehydrogenase PreA subunit